MEFLERGAYYSVMSILSVYLILSPETGGLGFTKEQAGAVLGIIPLCSIFCP
jgi:dipeptide/tripeptide permease